MIQIIKAILYLLRLVKLHAYYNILNGRLWFNNTAMEEA
jgi:hypothetical protein